MCGVCACDDFLDTDTFARVMPLAEACDILEYPMCCHYGSGRQQMLSLGRHDYSDAADYWLRGHAYEHSYACNKVYRRSLFQNVRYPAGRVFEDMATLPLLLQIAGRISTADCGCYYYADNPQGITATATGQDLQMLLEAHLRAMELWCDDRYYMHVLNIQLDVSRLTGQAPVLPMRRVSPLSSGLDMPHRLKALLLRMTGTERLCRIHQTITHR